MNTQKLRKKPIPEFVSDNLNRFNLSPKVAVLDIETLGKDSRCVVASIGCVIKNVITGNVVGEFYERINWRKQK